MNTYHQYIVQQSHPIQNPHLIRSQYSILRSLVERHPYTIRDSRGSKYRLIHMRYLSQGQPQQFSKEKRQFYAHISREICNIIDIDPIKQFENFYYKTVSGQTQHALMVSMQLCIFKICYMPLYLVMSHPYQSINDQCPCNIASRIHDMSTNIIHFYFTQILNLEKYLSSILAPKVVLIYKRGKKIKLLHFCPK